MSDIGFAALVTQRPDGTLSATHLPLQVITDRGEIRLEGHVARANDHWRDLEGAGETLAIFQGPQAYVSPSAYPSKAEAGKVVPTWGYITVHATGALRAHDDADWLHRHLTSISDHFEAGRSEPWAVSDAPDSYIAARMRGIVGISLAVTRLEGSWKLNQNKSDADQNGTAALWREAGEDGAAMAEALQAIQAQKT